MRRNAQGEEDVAHAVIHIGRGRRGQLGRLLAHALHLPRAIADAIHQLAHFHRLYHVVVYAQPQRAGDEILAAQGGQGDHPRALLRGNALHLLQHAEAVHLRHNQIQNYHVRGTLGQPLQRLHAVCCLAGNDHILLRLQVLVKRRTYFIIIVRKEYANLFHPVPPIIPRNARK